MMISGLARADGILGRKDWIEVVDTFCFVTESMADGDGLAHSYRTGEQHYFGLARW